MSLQLISTISESELSFIAALDYGKDDNQHLEALRAVVFSQAGVIQEHQYWYPYEVIELGSHALTAGHEREFAICTLLVINAVSSGADISTDLIEKFEQRAQDYDQLPEALKSEVLHAYQAAGC